MMIFKTIWRTMLTSGRSYLSRRTNMHCTSIYNRKNDLVQIPNLSHFSRDDLKTFLDSFDNVLCDCDGVLFIISTPLQGAASCITDLKRLGKTVKFITNNSILPRASHVKNLMEQGVSLVTDDIINPGKAVVDCLRQHNFTKKVFLIGLSGVRQELEEAGIKISNEYKPELIEVSNEGFLKHAYEGIDKDVGAVVVCYDFNVTYGNLDKAYRYLRDPSVLFITSGNDRKLIVGPENYCIGPSCFQDLLRDMSGREPLALGKPLKDFQEYIKKCFNYNSERTLFIGDSLEQDMRFASELGYKKLLVLSGNTKLEDLETCGSNVTPDYYIRSLGDLHFLINEFNFV